VIDAIENSRQIDIDHPAPATLHVALRLTDGVMRSTPRPKAIAGLREGGIALRLQDLLRISEQADHPFRSKVIAGFGRS
jgi:hypothetical protein